MRSRKAAGLAQDHREQSEKSSFPTASQAWDLGVPHRVLGQVVLPPPHQASTRAVLLVSILIQLSSTCDFMSGVFILGPQTL